MPGDQQLVPCPVCETPNPPGADYCDGCGINLARQKEIPDSAPPETIGNGRYRVERLLGEGANKNVYLAHDTMLERAVALSLIKGDGFGMWRTNPMAKARMLDEARLMARLGDHPHLVSVYDVGEEGGRTYLVCQLMTGGDLQGLVEQAPDRRLATTRALVITDQILQGLAYAHQHGIIHRDLKPANVWLTEEGGVKIGDLGLAMSVEPSRLQVAGAIVGTVAFMAPEQAAGQVPDERSDLYSVGAVLYAMLTGRPPFIGDDTVDVIDQHLHATPVAVRWFNPGVPAAVEGFTLRLLAKEPGLRPRSAQAARTELQGIAWALERGASSGGPMTSGAVDRLRNPLGGDAADVFVGRRMELGRLRERADAAFQGGGGSVLVGGEAGIGKTRLAEELATYARMCGADVLWGRCGENESAPYAPWVEVLGSLVGSLDADSLTEIVDRRAGDLARILPELVRRLPSVVPRPDLDADQSRWRLFDAMAGLLVSAARRRPLLVVLDDLHWADTASLRLLAFVAEAVQREPLLLLGLQREGEGADVRALLDESPGGRRTESISLQGLSPEEMERLVTLAVGWEPGSELLRAFHRDTAGNPFFASEMLRLLTGEETLATLTTDRLETLLPGGVQDLLRRRLSLLSAEARHLLEHASVLGLEVDEAVLRLLGADPPAELEGALAEAESARLLVRSPGGSVRFSHALLRATVLADLDPARRARLHLRAAEVLEDGVQPGRPGHAADIAYHLAEALPEGDPGKAASYALRAGGEATARFAWEEAVRQFERGLHICAGGDPGVDGAEGDDSGADTGVERGAEPGGDPRGCAADLVPSLAVGLGDALVALSRREEGVAAYESAVATLAASERTGGQEAVPGERLSVASIQHKIAVAHLADRRFAEATQAFDRALKRLPENALDRDPEQWEFWMAVQLSRAEAFYHAGALEDLSRLLETLAPLAEAHGTLRQRADLLAARTMLVLRRDRYRPGPEGVATATAELVARLGGDGSDAGLAAAYFRLGFVHLLRDEFDEARADLDAGARTAREIGDRVREAQAGVYLSRLDRRLGLVQATRLSGRRAFESATRAGLPGYAAAAQSDLAWVLLREGHVLEAREQATQALTAWGSGSAWPFEWQARLPLVAVAVGRGSLEEAGDHLAALLVPTQQVLPYPLTAAMERALEALSDGGAAPDGAAGVDEVLTSVVAEARAGNYA